MSDEILLARDHDPHMLRLGVRDGEIERVRRGAYRRVTGKAGSRSAVAARSRETVIDRARAVHGDLRVKHWFSHETAVVLSGLPVWRLDGAVHLVQHYRASSRAADDVRRHTLPVPLTQRATAHGLPVTSLVRTVADVVTTVPPLEGLVVADAALRRGVDLGAVREIVAQRYRGRARGAAAVIDLADDGAETPWESWLRYVALWAGLPRPRTQIEIETRLGTFRVDMGWLEHGVLAEYDGLVKYRDGELAPGYDASRALVEEKRRQDAITEATGIVPFRVTSKDAVDVDSVARRLVQRFPPHVRADARRRPPLTRPY